MDIFKKAPKVEAEPDDDARRRKAIEKLLRTRNELAKEIQGEAQALVRDYLKLIALNEQARMAVGYAESDDIYAMSTAPHRMHGIFLDFLAKLHAPFVRAPIRPRHEIEDFAATIEQTGIALLQRAGLATE